MAKKIRVYARTNINGSDVEDVYDAPDNWDEMPEDEQQEFLDEAAQTHLQNCVDCGAYVADE